MASVPNSTQRNDDIVSVSVDDEVSHRFGQSVRSTTHVAANAAWRVLPSQTCGDAGDLAATPSTVGCTHGHGRSRLGGWTRFARMNVMIRGHNPSPRQVSETGRQLSSLRQHAQSNRGSSRQSHFQAVNNCCCCRHYPPLPHCQYFGLTPGRPLAPLYAATARSPILNPRLPEGRFCSTPGVRRGSREKTCGITRRSR